ncbi:MAG: YbaB/EbfC family DNA-binding protein [Rhodococcus sp.]|uniref:YbaB/EbfC family nucleoid-associated protein n=1 Tax=Rhodococcus TaxID=1827 RepID=UPI001697044A|nr:MULTISPECIES: YbaB/EbfC family nucleoid-associated protein [Rhodococcus]NLV79930.1 YbaB/EbfC family DNA-binding protein [Rhodococcus sp. (in: high G+C Gram-positive bacteria)]
MSEARVEAIVDRIHTQMGAMESTLADLGAVRGTASNGDGSVVARVDSTGALAGLTLAESVTRRDAQAVAAEILAVAHEAARRAAAERVRLFDSLRQSLR